VKCHGDPNIRVVRDGEPISLYLDEETFATSTHGQNACAQCHVEANPNHPERACADIVNPVDCAACHAEAVQEHSTSVHGQLAASGDPDAPVCLDCHEYHTTQDQRWPTSPTYPRNVPELCARCHRQGESAAKRLQSKIPDSIHSYEMSIHGKGLVESGLVVSATCTDCHTAHNGNQALTLAEEKKPDLITLDISMPGMDITEVLEKIAASDVNGLKICIIGGRPELRNVLLDKTPIEISGFVDKPFTEDGLVARIREILQN